MNDLFPEKPATARRGREGTARRAAWAPALVFIACACPQPPPPTPPVASLEAPSPPQLEPVPDTRPAVDGDRPSAPPRRRLRPEPGRERLRPRTLEPAARAALHQHCPEPGCPEGLACLEYCGVAGCRPGSVFHTCELPCARGVACPEGFTCATISDGPGRVCTEAGGPQPRPRPDAEDR